MDSYVIRQAFSLQPYSFILFYRVSPKSFRLLHLNIFKSTKSTKVNEVYFLKPYEYSYHLSLLSLNLCKYQKIREYQRK